MKRTPIALAIFSAATLALGACSAGSLGSSDESSSGGGKVALSFLTDNQQETVKIAEGLAKDFTAKNPDITINVETRPQGTEGDNIVKTRLSTGDMTDMFMYNSGSLMQALAPQKNLTAVDEFAGQLDDNFKKSVTTDNKLYGVPFGNYMAGAILYNKEVYDKNGLEVPTTWDEFMANNAKLKAAGVDPVIQSYGDTWTSQLFILGDYYNVEATTPGWAGQYTTNKAKYATTPAAKAGFDHLQQVHDAGYVNKDFASAKLGDALNKLAKGQGAQYPILSAMVSQLIADNPGTENKIGLFAIPGTDAAKNGLTVWAPNGLYIPSSTTGDKLDAAKKFLAFVASTDGCASLSQAAQPTGPYAVKGCTLPDSVPQAVKDMQSYIDEPGASGLALEFLSPVKGPALEQICVEVGSGIRKADAAAKLYDEDVKKQAQQLGLSGW